MSNRFAGSPGPARTTSKPAGRISRIPPKQIPDCLGNLSSLVVMMVAVMVMMMRSRGKCRRGKHDNQ